MSAKEPVRQTAALAYRWQDDELQYLLITSLDTGRWVIPKGNIDPRQTARMAAAIEAFEEAGVLGYVAEQAIGTYDYKKKEIKGGGSRRVDVFPMLVVELKSDWPEKQRRKRKWMSVEKAVSAVDEDRLKELMTEFAASHPGRG